MNTSESDRLRELIAAWEQGGSGDRAEMAQWSRRVAWLQQADEGEAQSFLQAIVARSAPVANTPADARLAIALAQLERRWRASEGAASSASPAGPPSAALRQAILAAYQHLGSASSGRHHLLGILAVGGEPDLRAFADRIAADPPANPVAAAVTLWPLFTRQDYQPSWVFPRLLDGLTQLCVASSILDLCNYLVRHQRVAKHPAAERRRELIELLGSIVGRLGKLETRLVMPEDSLEQMRDAVSESVALAVALCDALALIGDQEAVGKLRQTMELGHRRLRVEAAAALARLGDDEGSAVLAGLAEEAAVRLRVVSYAEELGILDRVPEEYRSPVAKAEGELVAWLASPNQLGLPPQECDLIDSRKMFWPGYDDPVDCFLYRFAYELGDRQFRGIGLAGPMVHSFRADLSALPVDDLYAIFAGFGAQHEEIFELDVKKLSPAGLSDVTRLERRLHDAGFEKIAPVELGYFLGERTLIALAQRDDREGVVVADGEAEHWYPAPRDPRGPGPQEFYCLYKGRKLLDAFNT